MLLKPAAAAVAAGACGYGCACALLIGLAASLPGTARGSGPLDVDVVRPVRGEIHRFVTLPGSIRANREAMLYAKVAGYLGSLTVDKGDSVTEGQQLGLIEVPELVAELAMHRAEQRVAELEFERISAGQKRAPDLVMAQAVDEARGRLEIAKATADRTEAILAYRELRAPFAGVVTMRYVDPGAFIPAATAGGSAGGGAIVTIMDFATARVQVPVPEFEASLVRKGQPVTVTVPGLPGKKFAGKVDRFSYALDKASKTMLVEADLPNPQLELRPGMYATVAVGVEHHEGVLLLPAGAVLMEKAGASVFVNAGGMAKKTPVKTGFSDGAMVEVSEGLTGNETVIVIAGGVPPADGQAVSAKETK